MTDTQTRMSIKPRKSSMNFTHGRIRARATVRGALVATMPELESIVDNGLEELAIAGFAVKDAVNGLVAHDPSIALDPDSSLDPIECGDDRGTRGSRFGARLIFEPSTPLPTELREQVTAILQGGCDQFNDTVSTGLSAATIGDLEQLDAKIDGLPGQIGSVKVNFGVERVICPNCQMDWTELIESTRQAFGDEIAYQLKSAILNGNREAIHALTEQIASTALFPGETIVVVGAGFGPHANPFGID